MRTYLTIFFGITLIFISCEKNEYSNKNDLSILVSLKGENGLPYKKSLNKWADLKKLNGNSYKYQTTFLSWTGFGNTTELKIVDGKVIARIYHEFCTDNKTGKRILIDSYTENENSIGNHEKGASPLTIDELYNSCAANYLIVDDKKNTVYFETSVNGLMTLCGFVPDGGADEC